MKTIAVIFMFLSTLTIASQTVSPSMHDISIQTPTLVTGRFNASYPGTQPSWTMEGQNYRAEYLEGTMGRSVVYDPEGNVLSHDEQMSVGTYPAGITDYHEKNYPGEPYEVWVSTTTTSDKRYYLIRNEETFWFDTSGKYKNKTTSKLPKEK